MPHRPRPFTRGSSCSRQGIATCFAYHVSAVPPAFHAAAPTAASARAYSHRLCPWGVVAASAGLPVKSPPSTRPGSPGGPTLRFEHSSPSLSRSERREGRDERQTVSPGRRDVSVTGRLRVSGPRRGPPGAWAPRVHRGRCPRLDLGRAESLPRLPGGVGGSALSSVGRDRIAPRLRPQRQSASSSSRREPTGHGRRAPRNAGTGRTDRPFVN